MENISEQDRKMARCTNPTSWLESMGYLVRKDGLDNWKVFRDGREVFRFTKTSDGHFVHCDNFGVTGDDVIAMVMNLEGLPYPKAVRRLLNGFTMSSQPSQAVPVGRREKVLVLMNPTPAVVAQGRDYLLWRGISCATINYAESEGFLRYGLKYESSGPAGVLFCGYNAGQLVNVSWRLAIKGAKEQRNYSGSCKRYPQILRGHRDSRRVWIVEGGIDALAIRDCAMMCGMPPSTVIVTGGSGARSFLEEPDVKKDLIEADEVFIACENERDPATQLKTDAQHQAQADVVARIIKRQPVLWRPSRTEDKDVADLNLRKKQEVWI